MIHINQQQLIVLAVLLEGPFQDAPLPLVDLEIVLAGQPPDELQVVGQGLERVLLVRDHPLQLIGQAILILWLPIAAFVNVTRDQFRTHGD